MATLATDVKWGTAPTNLFNFSYEKQRSGTTQQYKITVECEPCTGASYYGYPIYLSITVNGSTAATYTLKTASPSQWSSALTYTTGWISVPNKTTGTTPLKIRIYSGMGSSRDATYSYTLDIDPAASKVGATDANIESTSTVTFTRYNSAFTHSLAYLAAGQSTYTAIFTKQDVTSYPWTVPASLYALIPRAKTIGITLRCQTYSGSTLVGTEYCEMTATAAENKCAPTISVVAADTNPNTIALTGNAKKIIRYHSDVAVTATVSARNSASISSTTLKCGSASASGTSYTFTDAESATVTATTTDSRNYPKTATAEGLSLVEYIKLTANTTVARTSPTADTVTVTTRGNYFNGSFGAVQNTIQCDVRWKRRGSDDDLLQATMAVSVSGNEYTATATLSGLDYQNDYDIQVRVQDQIYKTGGALAPSAVLSTTVLSKGIPVFDWGAEDFNINVPLTITGNPVNDIVVEQGSSGIWIYRKWASGIAECWGVSDAITQTTSTDWNIMTSNTPTPSIEYPFTFKNPPVVSPSVHIHNGNFWLVTYNAGSTTHTPTYQIARGKSATTITFKLGYYVFGQWK